MATEIPDIVIGRLPLYLRALTHLAEKGQTTTSSHELGQRLGISSAQIRKDLSHFGEFGKQGTGYHINFLIDQLRHILHLNLVWSIAIVGAGYLGHALAHYQGFEQRGFRVAWVFDNDPQRVGETVNGVEVRHINDMIACLREEHVQMALLAVPTEAAQETADMLIEAGITAILSYAPINLKVPVGVQVQYSDPVVQMQRMTYYLNATAQYPET
ncbi:MAG: redox-sensing transcriptional repressor Rex [Anaerolineae bacterium]|nr:redox-sensing transcriptional repressor Rex [Anaerolineae bacterium]MCO5190212.1 redox-sensing transcriptional repressor Rex [Anaerolineae bacterium]MCO5192529.1 redox-sensing transcriptional repressor Rex [Anaerolineae bacterium]MCO5198745.1 redox-sensing transcriptional repressor Rex [Anaerolineae bacterium]MCO5203583.1 redox-sensing transcriptional repressor Rex [Anaerolineae bacterium]